MACCVRQDLLSDIKKSRTLYDKRRRSVRDAASPQDTDLKPLGWNHAFVGFGSCGSNGITRCNDIPRLVTLVDCPVDTVTI